MKTRIYITASRSHHQPLQWREPHSSVDAPAIPDGRRATAITKVGRDELCLFERLAQPSRGFVCDVMMAGPMEAVPAYPMPFVVFVGNGIVKGICRERPVKPRIENGYLWFTGKNLGGNSNALCIRRIVEGSEPRKLFDSFDHVLGDESPPPGNTRRHERRDGQ